MKLALALASLAVAGLIWIALPDSTPPPAPKPAEVAALPSPTPEPKAEPVADESMKNALLGLDKPAEEPKAAPKRARRVIQRVAQEEEATEEVDTSLSDYQFQSAVGNWRGVKACLAQKAQQQKDDPTGALKVSFTISDHGEVVATKVYDFSNDLAKSLGDCVEREAKRVKFPAFTAAEPVVKEAKFVF